MDEWEEFEETEADDAITDVEQLVDFLLEKYGPGADDGDNTQSGYRPVIH